MWRELVLELGSQIEVLPTTYLDLPLGSPFKTTSMWDLVEERFQRRLVLRKRQYLSKRGRLTLVKCTLSSLPIYYVSVFHS